MNGELTTGVTMLERWRALAEIENKRARQTWGSTGGWYQRPEAFEDPEITARVGLAEASVARILRIRRLEAREGRTRA